MAERGRKREPSAELLDIEGVSVELTRKRIKTLRLSIHPPEGRVRISAPASMPLERIRGFASSKLPWILRHQASVRAKARETARDYVEGEDHYLWGQPYRLRLVEAEALPRVELGKGELLLRLRPGADRARREKLLTAWYRGLLVEAAEPLLAAWSKKLGVQPESLRVRRMKTRWGSCNPRSAAIRLNSELAKRPPECLEYVIVHELCHLIERGHGPRFYALMDRHLPGWRELRRRLDKQPLGHEDGRG